MLRDRFGRQINYLRVSVTDRCNLRCGYCMPEGAALSPMADLLTAEEIAFICAQAAALGIDRVKITGGEPLVRPDCAALVSTLKGIGGIAQVTMTTNGVLLKEHLDALLNAGLDAVNISLDSMDRAQYRAITGVDALERVMASVRAAVSLEPARRIPVRLNCVVQRGVNEDAPLQLAALARELPVDVRFIELMPIGAGRSTAGVPNAAILGMIEKRFRKTAEDAGARGNGPAVYRRAGGFAGRIGFISALHDRFCGDCNRLRLTAAGELKPCLCYAEAVPLKPILRDGGPHKAARVREGILEAVSIKPRAHCFERPAEVTESRMMTQIGG